MHQQKESDHNSEKNVYRKTQLVATCGINAIPWSTFCKTISSPCSRHHNINVYAFFEVKYVNCKNNKIVTIIVYI